MEDSTFRRDLTFGVILLLVGGVLSSLVQTSVNDDLDVSPPKDWVLGIENENFSPPSSYELDSIPPVLKDDTYGECKCIAAINNATAGDYNLLLKVRDPSRYGYQVLCVIERGYEYEYHKPWSGLKMQFTVKHRFIGTTTDEDVPPNIIKPGMTLSDAGIAYGDADTFSLMVNPSKHAWDDFDWIRYVCQEADTEEQAQELMTEDVVDSLHAPNISENIFIVGPQQGFVVEADAFRYKVTEIEDIAVQSNYPKELWSAHLYYPCTVGPAFNSTFIGEVAEGMVVRMGKSFRGIRVSRILPEQVRVKGFPFGGSEVNLSIGETEVVGNFLIQLMGIEEDKALISMCYKYFVWEAMIQEHMMEHWGAIGLQDMMNWSRLHKEHLNNIRGMCEGGYEVATVYKLPASHPDIMSSLWFAPDQCSSIFVPVHICARDIYDPFENGEAHQIALQLLEQYGHGHLTDIFSDVEKSFISDTELVEEHALNLLEQGHEEEAIEALTQSDLTIQSTAMLIEKMWLNMSKLSSTLYTPLGESIQVIWEMGRVNLGGLQRAISLVSSLIKERYNDEIALWGIQRTLFSLFLIYTNTVPVE